MKIIDREVLIELLNKLLSDRICDKDLELIMTRFATDYSHTPYPPYYTFEEKVGIKSVHVSQEQFNNLIIEERICEEQIITAQNYGQLEQMINSKLVNKLAHHIVDNINKLPVNFTHQVDMAQFRHLYRMDFYMISKQELLRLLEKDMKVRLPGED